MRSKHPNVAAAPPTFPLDQWFDLTKRITPQMIEGCVEQMQLYLFKSGDSFHPCCKEKKMLRSAAEVHNRQLGV